MNDILVFFQNGKEHEEYLEKFFDILGRHKVYAKRNKCQFFHTHIECLGYMLSEEGVLVNSKKIETMVRWYVPKDKIDVKCFFGLGKSVRNFA